MILKTRLVNPTSELQSYSWAREGGQRLAPGQMVELDGDAVYSRNMKQTRGTRSIDADIQSGRVMLFYITDIPTIRPFACEKTATVSATPTVVIPKQPEATQTVTAAATDIEDKNNLLGKGFVDVGEVGAEDKMAVHDLFTGKTTQDIMPETVSLSNAMWSGAFDDAVTSTGVTVVKMGANGLPEVEKVLGGDGAVNMSTITSSQEKQASERPSRDPVDMQGDGAVNTAVKDGYTPTTKDKSSEAKPVANPDGSMVKAKTKEQLEKMGLKQLKQMAKGLGLTSTATDVTKDELIDWILDSQK